MYNKPKRLEIARRLVDIIEETYKARDFDSLREKGGVEDGVVLEEINREGEEGERKASRGAHNESDLSADSRDGKSEVPQCVSQERGQGTVGLSGSEGSSHKKLEESSGGLEGLGFVINPLHRRLGVPFMSRILAAGLRTRNPCASWSKAFTQFSSRNADLTCTSGSGPWSHTCLQRFLCCRKDVLMTRLRGGASDQSEEWQTSAPELSTSTRPASSVQDRARRKRTRGGDMLDSSMAKADSKEATASGSNLVSDMFSGLRVGFESCLLRTVSSTCCVPS